MSVTPSPISVESVTEALQRSQSELVGALAGRSATEVEKPSYHRWTIAEVASHLGSGSEIFTLIVQAGVHGEAAPGGEQFAPIWDRWNAKPPLARAHDALTASATLLDLVAGLDQATRQEWALDLFGARRSLANVLAMRLAEEALHTWDIVVADDPGATVSSDAAGIILDELFPGFVPRVAKHSGPPAQFAVNLSAPKRLLELRLEADGSSLEPASGESAGAAVLRAPAESFVRLVYGRLDPAYSPQTVHVEGVQLDDLRRSFPGI